jgi:hypothetical protein
MRIKLLSIFLLFSLSSHSQTLIPDAKKVKTAFDKLSADTNSKELQQLYVAAFPSDTKTFLKIFQTEKFDQLYSDSYRYIDAFEKCAKNFPIQVISKCVDIGKNLVWDADAVGELQHISVQLSIHHLPSFVKKYKTLDSKAQNHLLRFYADVENFKGYPEYQELINKLKIIGEVDIAKKLENARTIRMAKNDQ